MRVILVAPPHSYATADVFKGYANALRRVPGVDLREWQLWPRIMFYDHALRLWAAGQRRDARARGETTTRAQFRPHRDVVLLKASAELVCDAISARADWVVIVCGIAFHPDTVRMLRLAGIKVAAVFTESPYEDPQARQFASFCDLVGVNDRVSLQHFGDNTFYLPTAYDRDAHHPGVEAEENGADVLLLGTGFKERVQLLRRVDWTGVDVRFRGHWRKAYRREPLLKPYIDPGPNDNGISIVHNSTTAKAYRGAKINLNMYRRDREAESVSPRAWELAALGTFALHEEGRAEAREVFGGSVGYFDGPQALGEAVRYYLQRPELRAQMARESWERVQGQSYDERAGRLLAAMDRVSTPRLVAVS